MESSISFEIYVIMLLFLAVLSLAFYSMYTRKKVGQDADNPYMKGLKFMAEGENRLAIEKLKEAVLDNSANIDAYVKLGVILRNSGLFKNAIRIHKDLTLRGNLSAEDLLEVRKNLVLDYWSLNDYENAEYYLNQIKQSKSMFEWAAAYLVQIMEMKKDWKAAYELLSKTSAARDEQGKLKLAEFKVRQGIKVASEQKEKDARIIFKEALKLNVNCAEAYLQIGDSYLREKRVADAINAWTDLCKKVPAKASQAFERLEKAWFEKGHFSKIEELYFSLIEESDDNLNAIIALSEIYRKKGEHSQALKLLQDALKRDLDMLTIQKQMVKVYMDKSQYKDAASLALKIIEKI